MVTFGKCLGSSPDRTILLDREGLESGSWTSRGLLEWSHGSQGHLHWKCALWLCFCPLEVKILLTRAPFLPFSPFLGFDSYASHYPPSMCPEPVCATTWYSELVYAQGEGIGCARGEEAS